MRPAVGSNEANASWAQASIGIDCAEMAHDGKHAYAAR
jgi:hypothetical protein